MMCYYLNVHFQGQMVNDDLDSVGSSDFGWHYCKERARFFFCHLP